MITQTIVDQLKKIIKELGVTDGSPQLEIPTDLAHGDYTTNVAFQLSKRLKKAPMQIAEEIVKAFSVQRLALSNLEKVEAVNPGFINFWIAKEALMNNLDQFLDDEENIFQTIKTKKPQFEMYENTQPNTNKPLHIGHLRNTALALSIVNLRKAIGHTAWSVNINNDRGIHIIKAMWAYLMFGKIGFKNSEDAKKFDIEEYFNKIKNQISKIKNNKEEYIYWKELLKDWFEDKRQWQTPENYNFKPDHFVGIFYMLGDRAIKEKPEHMTHMQEMLLAWESNNPQVRALWATMNNWFYKGFKETHARFLGIKAEDEQFDKEWYESDVYEAGKQIVLDNLGKGLFYKREDNVIMADLKKYNLPDKVVIRSDGSSLYITQDIELERLRIQEDNADLAAIVIGNEQELYFKQLFAIEEALGFGTKENFLCLTYGMVNLKGGVKMSSREGTVILADDLLDAVKEKIQKTFHEIPEDTAEKVAIGAVKYAMLKYNSKGNIEFDIEESISIEGNSGSYIQYTYVRTHSILEKAKKLPPPLSSWLVQDLVSKQKFQVPSESEDSGQAGMTRKGNNSPVPELARNDGEKNVSNHATNLPARIENEEMLLLRSIYQFSSVVETAAEHREPHVVSNYLYDLSKSFNFFYQKYRILDAKSAQEKQLRLSLTKGVGTVIKKGLDLLGIAAPEKM